MLLGLISFPELRPTVGERPTMLIMPVIERPAFQARVKGVQARTKAKLPRKFIAPTPPSPRMPSQTSPTADPAALTLDPGPLRVPEIPAASPPTLPPPSRPVDFGTAEALASNSLRKSSSEAGAFDPAVATARERRNNPISRPSGFVAAEAAEAKRPRASVAANAGFGAAVVAEPVRSSSRTPSASASTPVEILEKPRPTYTQEARRAAIEGEVLLEVLFDASGKARVSRILRGLGHGLDEQAAVAAERIRFRPATRGGAPVDSSVVVHVVFQLAY